MTDMEQRRRRAAYRASHRGTKEMDWLLGRYAEGRLEGMEEAELTRFEQLIALADPDLQQWLMSPGAPPRNDLSDLVEDIRAFHGLGLKGASAS